MGSSAALSVAVFGALMKFTMNIWNPVRINELAYEAEKLQHGNPSGGDNTVTALGGLLWYRKEFEFLKSIWSLPAASYRIPQFIIINSGKPLESTGEMVAIVAANYKKKKVLFTRIFDLQEEQTKNLLLSFRNGDLIATQKSLISGERNLEKMGAVGKMAMKIIAEIEKIGGAAKITGAGGLKKGSGLILCLHKDAKKILSVGKKYKLETFPVVLGGEGVKVEV
jgi:mevalonate kinase